MKSVSLMQQSLNIAARWTSNNDTKINPEKSKEIIICFAQGSNPRNDVPVLVLDGNVVKRVDHVKLLGVTLSHDLTCGQYCTKSWQTSVHALSAKKGRC